MYGWLLWAQRITIITWQATRYTTPSIRITNLYYEIGDVFHYYRKLYYVHSLHLSSRSHILKSSIIIAAIIVGFSSILKLITSSLRIQIVVNRKSFRSLKTDLGVIKMHDAVPLNYAILYSVDNDACFICSLDYQYILCSK